MLKTTYKTRNARRRMDELRRFADEGAKIVERHYRLLNSHRYCDLIATVK